MFNIFSSIVSTVFDKSVEILKRNHIKEVIKIRDSSISAGAIEFTNVTLQTSPIKQSLYIGTHISFWILSTLFCISFIQFITGTTSDSINSVLILFGFIFVPVSFLFGYSNANVSHRNYSGLGANYDNYVIGLHKRNIIVNNLGISGMIEILWSDLETVADLDKNKVELISIKKGFLPSFLQLPPLIIIFSNEEEKVKFLHYLEKEKLS